MDTSSVLTMLGLIAAVYAVIPKENRLDISLRLSRLDKVIIVISFIAIHYLLYYQVLNEIGLKYNFGKWKWGFNENNTIYLIFLILSIYLAIKIKTFKVSKRNINSFSDLLLQLIASKKYEDAHYLIKRHMAELLKVSSSKSTREKIANHIMPPKKIDILDEVEENNSYVIKLKTKIASLIRENEEYKDEARVIILRTFNNKGFVEYLTISDPYYLPKVMEIENIYSRNLLKLYFEKLIDDTGSILYYELENSQNLREGNRFSLDPRNKLLYRLFNDCNISKNLSVYKPVGDKLCNLIDYEIELKKRYNEPLGNYEQDGKYQCPIYAGIQFFNIMILESLHQNIKWHMWLYYYQSFTSKMVQHMFIDESIDQSREWPTPFHYHLYQMVSNCIDWIYQSEYIEDQSAVGFSNINLNHENGSIIKSSILCLGNIIKTIISSDNISDKFKIYILEIVLRQMDRYKDDNKFNKIHQVMKRSIIYNGYRDKADHKYLLILMETFESVDFILSTNLSDFEKMIETAMDA